MVSFASTLFIQGLFTTAFGSTAIVAEEQNDLAKNPFVPTRLEDILHDEDLGQKSSNGAHDRNQDDWQDELQRLEVKNKDETSVPKIRSRHLEPKSTKAPKSQSPTKAPSYFPSSSTMPSSMPSLEFFSNCTPPERVALPADANMQNLVNDYLNGGTAETDQYGTPLGCWKTGAVTNMDSAFRNQEWFTGENEFIEYWDVSSATSMNNMFRLARSFNQPLENWNVTSVLDMNSMFRDAFKFNQPLNNWQVTSVLDMSYMFHYGGFNQPLNDWQVTSVLNMYGMFFLNSKFNQPLNDWNVTSVLDMGIMFSGASKFDQPLNNWQVTSVLNMYGMFSGAKLFNQPLNDWQVTSVTDMTRMFFGAEAFNQPLNDWQVTSVNDMSYMFTNAQAFNQCLFPWGDHMVGRTVATTLMFGGSACLSENDPQSPFDSTSWCRCGFFEQCGSVP